MKQVKSVPTGESAERCASNPKSNPISEYDGVPFDAIVSTWLSQRGIAGEVAEGSRNTTLYQLARDLRYIMDFNVEKMVATLPKSS